MTFPTCASAIHPSPASFTTPCVLSPVMPPVYHIQYHTILCIPIPPYSAWHPQSYIQSSSLSISPPILSPVRSPSIHRSDADATPTLIEAIWPERVQPVAARICSPCYASAAGLTATPLPLAPLLRLCRWPPMPYLCLFAHLLQTDRCVSACPVVRWILVTACTSSTRRT